MHFKIFLRQLGRSGKRTALYILLLTAVTAFFVMSVNLYRSSTQNLASLEDTYSTIAVMELKGDVGYHGELKESDSEGYPGGKSVTAHSSDSYEIISDVLCLDCKTGCLIRFTEYGAWEGIDYCLCAEGDPTHMDQKQERDVTKGYRCSHCGVTVKETSKEVQFVCRYR